jgi:hypothetical protein
MRVFLNKTFNKWARKEGVSDQTLVDAAKEVAGGQVEADLGKGLFKKRVARAGQGKRRGFRTLIGYCSHNTNRVIFLDAFAKNEKSNINDKEKEALQTVAQSFFATTDEQVTELIASEGFREITIDEQDTC